MVIACKDSPNNDTEIDVITQYYDDDMWYDVGNFTMTKMSTMFKVWKRNYYGKITKS